MPKREKVMYGSFFVALIGYALTVALGMFSYERAVLIWQFYLSPLLFLAIGTLLMSDGMRLNRARLVCMLFPLWYLLCHLMNGELYLYNEIVWSSPFLHFIKLCAAYSLFLWMFSVCPPSVRKRLFYGALSILLAMCAVIGVCSILGSLSPEGIQLPVVNTAFFMRLGRLQGGANSNTTAIVVTLGSILALFFMVSLRRVWSWIVGCLLLAVFYITLALTNARTCTITFSLCGAALVTLRCQGFLRGGRVKRSCVSLLLGAACAALLFVGCKGVTSVYGIVVAEEENPAAASVENARESGKAAPLFQLLSSASAEEQLASATVPQPTPTMPNMIPAERPLSYALNTLNNRTTIWADTLQYCFEHPKAFLFGVLEEKYPRILALGSKFKFNSTHNSWFQALLTTGLPGLAIALYLTFLSLKAAWLAIKNQRCFAHTVLAVGLLASLMIGFMESTLFVDFLGGSSAFANMLFFLILGYLRAEQCEALPG